MVKILYIEDNEGARNSTKLILERLGHTVISRVDTDGVFAMADIWKPDLVITDHDLGEGKEKGLQLALRLKADGVKVVILSGNDDALSDARKAVIPFFTKPCKISTLLAEMEVH